MHKNGHLNRLFERWIKEYPDKYKSHFKKDGIIDESLFANTKPQVLFIAKEANDEEKTEGDFRDWWNKKIQELSKGMAQKIQFVVTVLHEPKLLIFDEPFSGFDPINVAIIRDEILELKKGGTTIIFSTHRMESVEEICDNIALINNGKTILEGAIEKIKNDFRSNIFSVKINTENLTLPEQFQIISNTDNNYQIQISENATSNQLLNALIEKCEIISFQEKIPTMEDIFIKAVKDE